MNNETAAVEVHEVPVAAQARIAGQCGAGVVCKAMDLALESGRRVPRPRGAYVFEARDMEHPDTGEMVRRVRIGDGVLASRNVAACPWCGKNPNAVAVTRGMEPR